MWGDRVLSINRNLKLLLFGQFVSQLGDKAYNIILMWWLFEKTNSSGLVSSFLIVAMLPELIFGPVAGVYIDRWRKKRILVAADCFRGAVILILSVLYGSNHMEIWHIYSAALCISFCSALFNPTIMSVMPVIAAKGELQRVNALSQTVTGVVSILGPLLGASSLALIGYMGVLIFNGCSYLISGISAAFLEFYEKKNDAKESIQFSLAQGFCYIGEDARVSVVVVVVSILHVFVGSIVVVMPFLANLLSGNGINNMGVLQSALGGGMIIGAGYISKYLGNKLNGLYLFYSMIFMGLGILALGALQSIHIRAIEFYALASIIIGMCIAMASVIWRTIAQLCVPEEMNGRVFSVMTTAGNISLPISMAVSGIVLNYINPELLLWYAGVSLCLIGIVLIYTGRNIFRNITI